MDQILVRELVRSYYFAEAMAFYELYYRPLIESYEPARSQLVTPERADDRPPTWVPLVFHCTRADRVEEIIRSGELKPGSNGALSFSEVPLGELDRLKYRFRQEDQVAFAFPRRALSRFGFAPVLYARQNGDLKDALRMVASEAPAQYARIAPFVEENDDVSPFFEVRTTSSIPLENAVWLLTTKQTPDGLPDIPALEMFAAKFGKISRSYWHTTHQMELLGEPQFIRFMKNDRGELTGFQFRGEHYWKDDVSRPESLTVQLPRHDRQVEFSLIDPDSASDWSGPWGFIDIARILFSLLSENVSSIDDLLGDRLIRKF